MTIPSRSFRSSCASIRAARPCACPRSAPLDSAPRGRTLAEVRDAVGHSNVSITPAYLHVVVDDDQGVGSLFKFKR